MNFSRLVLVCLFSWPWPIPGLSLGLHGTLTKASQLRTLPAQITFVFNPSRQHPTRITLPVETGVAESDGRGRVQFQEMKVAMNNFKLKENRDLWAKFLNPQEYPEMIFTAFSGQKGLLMGSLGWRGVDRLIRTPYNLKSEKINFTIPAHLIDWAFEEAPPSGLEVDSAFSIEVEVPVRYVRTSERRAGTLQP